MYYIIYKITNQINGKIYIGAHKTPDLDDGYMGSGKYIRHSIAKYGIDNFIKEILYNFSSVEEMYGKEAEIVNEEFVKREDTYNLNIGGISGSWYYCNSTGQNVGWYQKSPENAKYIMDEWKRKYENDKKFQEEHKDRSRKQLAKNRSNGLSGFHMKHTEETKRKMSESSKGKGIHKANSQYGTMWITDGEKNKKQLKDQPIPKGWRKGRIMGR